MPDWICCDKTGNFIHTYNILNKPSVHINFKVERSVWFWRGTGKHFSPALSAPGITSAATLPPLHPAISVTPALSGGSSSHYRYTILITMSKEEEIFRMHCFNTLPDISLSSHQPLSLLDCLHYWSFGGIFTSTIKIYFNKYFCIFLIVYEVTQNYKIIGTLTCNHARKWWSRERSANEEVHLSVEGFDTNCKQEIGEKLVNWSHHWRDQIAVNQ